jgi:hypothetical protein
MKRKFTFLLFIGICSVADSFSQSYVPLPLQNCEWYFSAGSGTSNSSLMQTCLYNDNYKLYPNGDSIISGKRYIKIYMEWINGSGGAIAGPPCTPYSPPSATLSLAYGLRQDTLAKKVYIKPLSSSSPETILYDFNLVKNDTVKTANSTFGSIPPCGTTKYRIIDSVFYQAYSDGICRKTYRLIPYANCANFISFSYIIEGFGTDHTHTDMVVYTNNNFGGFGSGNMTTVSASTLVIGTTTLSKATNTCSQSVGIKEQKTNLDISLFPNPVKNKLVIQGLGSQLTQIELFSVLGQKQEIRVSDVEQTLVLDLENCPAGIYILRISAGGRSYSKKILKSD